MTEQPTLIDVSAAPRPLTPRQQAAWDYVRDRQGVTAAEVGAHLYALRGSPAGHRSKWDARDGLSVLRSKALKPLVTYKRTPDGNQYVARDARDRVRPAEPVREPTDAELAANPFAGL